MLVRADFGHKLISTSLEPDVQDYSQISLLVEEL
jgi:hypothetical protein